MRIPRPELVARVVTFLRDNVGDPVTVAEMSGMAGVSERTLRAAFRGIIDGHLFFLNQALCARFVRI